jgi:hypothetical protein
MIVCSECGRAVSNKATACVGCGAPISSPSEIEMVARNKPVKPPTLGALKRHLIGGAITLALGLFAAMAADRMQSSNRIDQLIAALLLIAGISWTLVTLVRLWSFKRP